MRDFKNREDMTLAKALTAMQMNTNTRCSLYGFI